MCRAELVQWEGEQMKIAQRNVEILKLGDACMQLINIYFLTLCVFGHFHKRMVKEKIPPQF